MAKLDRYTLERAAEICEKHARSYSHEPIELSYATQAIRALAATLPQPPANGVEELEWLHRFINCTPFGEHAPQADIDRAHRIVDALRALATTLPQALAQPHYDRTCPCGKYIFGIPDALATLPQEPAVPEEVAAQRDAECLTWLSENSTLHTRVEILYVVDGYEVQIWHEDGVTKLSPAFWGSTLAAAISAAIGSAMTKEGEVSKYCVSCGSPLPDSHKHRNCSMCYGDIDYGTDGYYRRFMEGAQREAAREAQEREQEKP